MKGVLRTSVITIPSGTTVLTAKFIVRRVAAATPGCTFQLSASHSCTSR